MDEEFPEIIIYKAALEAAILLVRDRVDNEWKYKIYYFNNPKGHNLGFGGEY